MKRKEKAAVDEFVALVGARHGSLYAINVWVNGVV